jgi:hypothetical protein
MKVKTMKLSGNEYAKVAERLKVFREDWPKSKIETENTTNEDGSVEFKAWVWKDKTEYLTLLQGTKDVLVARGSADANGSSKASQDVLEKTKGYEKLETIAVGRALAMLGYLGSGEIASFEEMGEFDEFKLHKHREAVKEAIERLLDAPDIEALKDTFMSLGNLIADAEVIAAKDLRKQQLTEPTNADS